MAGPANCHSEMLRYGDIVARRNELEANITSLEFRREESAGVHFRLEEMRRWPRVSAEEDHMYWELERRAEELAAVERELDSAKRECASLSAMIHEGNHRGTSFAQPRIVRQVAAHMANQALAKALDQKYFRWLPAFLPSFIVRECAENASETILANGYGRWLRFVTVLQAYFAIACYTLGHYKAVIAGKRKPKRRKRGG